MSLVHRLQTAGLSVFMLLASASCVTSGGTVGGGGGGNNPVILTLNGRAVKADELIKSPAFHQAFQQFAYGEIVRQAAAKEGIKPNAADIEKQLAEQKDRMSKMGMKWEDMLKQQGMSEADVQDMMEMQDLHKQLVKKLAGEVKDSEIEDAWAKRRQEILQNYAATNSLSEAQKNEAETKGLADPKLKEFIKDQVEMENGQRSGNEAIMSMLREMKVGIPSLGDAKTQEQYANMIFKANLPPDPDEQAKKAEEAEAEAEAGQQAQPEEGAAEGAPPAEGEAGADSQADGAGEGEGATPPPPPAETPPAPPAGGK